MHLTDPNWLSLKVIIWLYNPSLVKENFPSNLFLKHLVVNVQNKIESGGSFISGLLPFQPSAAQEGVRQLRISKLFPRARIPRC